MACLDLRGRDCLVVGGGRVATEKVQGLLECDALVTIVAPQVDPELRNLSVRIIRRAFERADATGRFLVMAATNDRTVNAEVAAASGLCNVADDPELCNFILPAIVRSGPLAIAISTAGASPALAKRMKREIEGQFGEPYARLAVLLNEVRGWAKGTLPTYQDRKEFFEGIVNGQPDPVALLREGDDQGVRDLIARAQSAHALQV